MENLASQVSASGICNENYEIVVYWTALSYRKVMAPPTGGILVLY